MTNEQYLKNLSLPGEEWQEIPGFEGMYAVSSFGRVTSLNRIIPVSKTKGCHIIKGCPIGYAMTSNDYLQVRLWKSNKPHYYYVHRLVAMAFIPNPNNYEAVDHIDTNKLNNTVTNLRWCSYSMNNLNPITRGRMLASYGKDPKTQRWIIRPVVRVNPENTDDIKFYESISQTGKDGFNPSQISAVCKGKRKSYYGYIWYYREDYLALINKSKNESTPMGSSNQ